MPSATLAQRKHFRSAVGSVKITTATDGVRCVVTERQIRTFFHRAGLAIGWAFGIGAGLGICGTALGGGYTDSFGGKFLAVFVAVPIVVFSLSKLIDLFGWIFGGLGQASSDDYPLPWRDSSWDFQSIGFDVMSDSQKVDVTQLFLTRRWARRIGWLGASVCGGATLFFLGHAPRVLLDIAVPAVMLVGYGAVWFISAELLARSW